MTRPGLSRFFVTALMAVATGMSWPASALATPDWDGDLFTDTDCRPLDPAVHPLATDYPDLTFEDMNCDGVDGDKTGAYFVSPSGANSNSGTYSAPFQTIGRALVAAQGSTTKSIYVATGTYEENLHLLAGHHGVRIYGGYQAGTWTRTTSASTVVNGHPAGAVLEGVRDVVFQLITLSGTTPGVPLTTYGIRAVDRSEFALIGATATAGQAGGGAAGVNFGGTAVQGSKGADGATPASCLVPGAGGSGGPYTGTGTPGGAGGAGGETTNDGEDGAPGTKGDGILGRGGEPGAGGVDEPGFPQLDLSAMNGQPGHAGQDGDDGPSGTGANGSPLLFLSGAPTQYETRDSTGSGSGTPGYGGGGGGGGSGRGASLVLQAGAGGGQGGQGGGGGSVGGGGSGGGGSFGVYLSSSGTGSTLSAATIVDGSVVHGGNGGTGGAGAIGGTGKEGGEGGAGGTVRTDCGITGGAGGKGGPGGHGGDGGNGGGGAGGPSVGLLGIQARAFVRDSTLTSGTGGPGGAATSPATPGLTGLSQPVMGSIPNDTDFDGDTVFDANDECVDIAPSTDADNDGCPDRAAAVPDADDDGTPDSADGCAATPPGSTDANGDGCPDSPAAGTDPGNGTTPNGPGSQTPDTTAPLVTFAIKAQRALRAKALAWSAKSNELCSLTSTAMLGKKALGRLTGALRAGVATKLKIKLSKKAVVALAKALRAHRQVKLKLKTTCVDAVGNKVASAPTLVVKR